MAETETARFRAETLSREQIIEINEQLEAKAQKGFLVNNAVLRELNKMEPSERENLIRWLGCEDGAGDLKALHDVSASERRSLAEFNRTRRNYNNRKPFAEYRPPESDTDKWIRERKEARRKGIRR